MTSRVFLFAAAIILMTSCISNNGGQNNSSDTKAQHVKNNKNIITTLNENSSKCDADNGDACYSLAGFYRQGWGVKKDLNKARSLFLKACNLNQYEACHNAAVMYAKGHGASKDPQQAFDLYEKSCMGGLAIGCNRGGLLYMQAANPTAEQTRKAENLFNISCDLKNSDGCKFAKLFSDARDGKDTSRSLYESEFEYQCYEGDYASCQTQAERYMHGNGPVKDVSKAADFYNRACLGGNIGKACHQLGLMLIPGKSNAGNLKKSLAYFDHGCSSKYEDSCQALASIYLLGQVGAPIDLDKSEYYMQKYCSLVRDTKEC